MLQNIDQLSSKKVLPVDISNNNDSAHFSLAFPASHNLKNTSQFMRLKKVIIELIKASKAVHLYRGTFVFINCMFVSFAFILLGFSNKS